MASEAPSAEKERPLTASVWPLSPLRNSLDCARSCPALQHGRGAENAANSALGPDLHWLAPARLLPARWRRQSVQRVASRRLGLGAIGLLLQLPQADALLLLRRCLGGGAQAARAGGRTGRQMAVRPPGYQVQLLRSPACSPLPELSLRAGLALPGRWQQPPGHPNHHSDATSHDQVRHSYQRKPEHRQSQLRRG